MTVEERVVHILQSLSDLRQQQVLDFAEFLQMRGTPEPDQASSQSSMLFGDGLATFRESWQIESLEINPDDVFADVRDPSPGREIVL